MIIQTTKGKNQQNIFRFKPCEIKSQIQAHIKHTHTCSCTSAHWHQTHKVTQAAETTKIKVKNHLNATEWLSKD